MQKSPVPPDFTPHHEVVAQTRDHFNKELIALLGELEVRASEIAQPSGIKLPDGAKDTQWHCESRSAGIRDAIHAIRLKFGIKP